MNSLLKLFNNGLFDFAKEVGDGEYEGVDWPTQATHHLVPTSWNSDRLYKPNSHGKKQKPLGFALSVCAVPLHRKFRLRGKLVQVRATLPPVKERPIYVAAGDLDGKRSVLRWMIEAQRAKVSKRFLAKASSAQLDVLYRNLLLADTYYRK